MSERAIVPCGSCRLCCRLLTMLEPDKGDDVFSYNHVVWKRDGKDVFALARMPNGDCYYLDEKKGCTIWHRAPSICRDFDCRKSYQKHKDVFEIYQRGKELSEALIADPKE